MARLLERLGVDGERICQEVRKEIDPNFFAVPRGLTPAAEQVIWAARAEAERLQHKFLSTEHLLLALIKIGDGIAVAMLQEAGLDLETVRAEVEQLVGPSPDEHARSPIRYAPRVTAILLAAAEEARVLGRAEVGSDHLALALLREDRGVAALVLTNLNLDVEQIRRDVLKRLA